MHLRHCGGAIVERGKSWRNVVGCKGDAVKNYLADAMLENDIGHFIVSG
jgi:hypothetical protein